MPVDTRNKRASVTNLFTPLPLADGNVAAGDRRQVSWVYAAGLTALDPRGTATLTLASAAAAVSTSSGSATITLTPGAT